MGFLFSFYQALLLGLVNLWDQQEEVPQQFFETLGLKVWVLKFSFQLVQKVFQFILIILNFVILKIKD